MGEHGERHTDGGFQSGVAERRLFKRDFDLVGCVGRVVAGYAVDRAVIQALDHDVDIELGSQWRGDLEVGPEFSNGLISEGEVHRAYFASDRGSEVLGLPDHLYRAPSADAHDVELAAGVEA